MIVVRPDKRELEAIARISVSHLNFPNPNVSIDERWRITVSLTDRTAEEVPFGSKIFVSPEVRDAIL
ncbi:MAG: hypothetical protein J0M24_26015 [Verrucomicrobia bacterium]|nr:hypothetical protein [Verrucomicrobiota bacterium]